MNIFLDPDLWGKCKSWIRLIKLCEIKTDLKNAIGVDTSKFAKKVDLVSLKSETDKLDNGKFRTTPVDLIRLSDAVKNKVIKRTIHHELVKKFNAV